MAEETNNVLRETLKKRLELELGLPLSPQSSKQVEPDFNDSTILLDNFPVISIRKLMIGGKRVCPKDYIVVENEGAVYLNKLCSGMLYVEYIYGLSESEYDPLIDLMMDYELDNSFDKNASSVSEGDLSVSYDTSKSKGALIQNMIDDLKIRYSCVVRMI